MEAPSSKSGGREAKKFSSGGLGESCRCQGRSSPSENEADTGGESTRETWVPQFSIPQSFEQRELLDFDELECVGGLNDGEHGFVGGGDIGRRPIAVAQTDI